MNKIFISTIVAASLIGFALFTRSIYNLIIGIEFIVIMIPHIMLENVPLKEVYNSKEEIV